MQRLLSSLLAPIATLIASLVIACGGGEPVAPTVAPNAPLAPTPNATETARRLVDTTEGSYMAHMSEELGALVRSQPWFAELNDDYVDLIASILKTERAAKAKGEADSVHEMLSFASEQGWYADGLDSSEARGLRGAFLAYEESLTDRFGPTIGPVLATTLKFGLFEAIDLVGGELIVVVSADDPAVGRTVLEKSLYWLPQIEALVGAYPYSFLHLMVTDVGEQYAGLSYDEFIALSPKFVDDETIVHELTHSTMYGSFPIWFEEGFAHFVEFYMTESLPKGVASNLEDLDFIGFDSALQVGAYRDVSLAGYLAERMQGFLFMNQVYELNGIDTLIGTIREIRTKSLSDQELLRVFVGYGTTEERRRMEEHFCKNVIGTSRNYCPPDRPF